MPPYSGSSGVLADKTWDPSLKLLDQHTESDGSSAAHLLGLLEGTFLFSALYISASSSSRERIVKLAKVGVTHQQKDQFLVLSEAGSEAGESSRGFEQSAGAKPNPDGPAGQQTSRVFQ